MSPDPKVLASRVRGPVLLPEAQGFDHERAGYQTALQHRPAVIVGATRADDVRAAVEFAGTNRLPVAVHGSGHGLGVPAEGGVLISTRRMSGIRVNVEARTAWLGAGVRAEAAVEAAARCGLAPLNGSAKDVCVVGYTIGGGLGLLARQYGYAADHVRAVDVVTADGNRRHVTAETDPDLFWALRGAGHNFGVVTGIEVDLVPVTRVYGGGLVFDAEHVADVLRTYVEWTGTVPEELTSSVCTLPYPDIPAIPEPLRGRYVAHIRLAYTGDAATGDRLVAPLRAIGPRLIDTLGDMPYRRCGSIYNDPRMPHPYYGDSAILRELNPADTKAVPDLAGPDAQAMCIVELRHLGGALARPAEPANPVGHRNAQYLLRILSPLGPSGIDTIRPVHQRFLGAFAPDTLGRCMNFVYGMTTTPDQVRTGYHPDDYQRLAQLKAAYDPTNTFRFNHNIPPAE